MFVLIQSLETQHFPNVLYEESITLAPKTWKRLQYDQTSWVWISALLLCRFVIIDKWLMSLCLSFLICKELSKSRTTAWSHEGSYTGTGLDCHPAMQQRTQWEWTCDTPLGIPKYTWNREALPEREVLYYKGGSNERIKFPLLWLHLCGHRLARPKVIWVKYKYAKIFPYTCWGSERGTELGLWGLEGLETVEKERCGSSWLLL